MGAGFGVALCWGCSIYHIKSVVGWIFSFSSSFLSYKTSLLPFNCDCSLGHSGDNGRLSVTSCLSLRGWTCIISNCNWSLHHKIILKNSFLVQSYECLLRSKSRWNASFLGVWNIHICRSISLCESCWKWYIIALLSQWQLHSFVRWVHHVSWLGRRIIPETSGLCAPFPKPSQ